MERPGRKFRPESLSAAALAAALWTGPASYGWAGPADAALRSASAGGEAFSFDAAPSRQPGLLIVAEPAQSPSDPNAPKLVERKAAVAMKASDILPAVKIEAPKQPKSTVARDGFRTVGLYTGVVGGGLAFAGMAAAIPVVGAALLLFGLSFAF